MNTQYTERGYAGGRLVGDGVFLDRAVLAQESRSEQMRETASACAIAPHASSTRDNRRRIACPLTGFRRRPRLVERIGRSESALKKDEAQASVITESDVGLETPIREGQRHARRAHNAAKFAPSHTLYTTPRPPSVVGVPSARGVLCAGRTGHPSNPAAFDLLGADRTRAGTRTPPPVNVSVVGAVYSERRALASGGFSSAVAPTIVDTSVARGCVVQVGRG